MAVPLALLGVLPHAAPIVPWVIEQLGPTINELKMTYGGDAMAMATDRLIRLGDLIVWEGETGRHVVAGLASLGDSQQRIESAVGAIEATQLSMAGTLGVVNAVTMTTLGVTSLSAGYMMWRLNALDKRLGLLATQVADIKAHLDAKDKGMLDSSLDFLHSYEKYQKAKDLHSALELASVSVHTLGTRVEDECSGPKRLSVLNYRGRRYLLALLTELQCHILEGYPDKVSMRVQAEQSRLKLLVEANFQQSLGVDPEQYLHPALKESGVTLDLLTDLYRQLQNARVVEDVKIRGAADLFEHLRQKIYRQSWLQLPTFSDWKRPLLDRIRYLVAAVEDVNRVESLRLLVDHSAKTGSSVDDIRTRIEGWIQEIRNRPDVESQSDTIVFQFT